MRLEVGKKYRTSSPANSNGWVEILKEHLSRLVAVDHNGYLFWIDDDSFFKGSAEKGPFTILEEVLPPVHYSVELYASRRVAPNPEANDLIRYLFGYSFSWTSSESLYEEYGYIKYRITVESVDD